MRQREEGEREVERTMVGNINDLVLPYIEKLRDGHLNESQAMCLDMIESTLSNIISPFLQGIRAFDSRFTPSELRIAHLIKSGRVTKEIAKLLNVGTGTVDTHRKSIRQKLGLSNKKVNLQAYLHSLEDG
jgi:DNA-binding CsgD family transcriptional regulator